MTNVSTINTMRTVPNRSVGDSEFRVPGMLMDSEYRARKAQLSGSWKTHTFFVLFDWYSALSKMITEVKDEEVVLPFERCVFEFLYMSPPMKVAVMQDSESKELTITEVAVKEGYTQDSTVTYHELLTHVRYTCLALEAKLASKEPIPVSNKPLALLNRGPKDMYRVLPISTTRSQGSKTGNKTGIKQRFHIRRGHWRNVNNKRIRVKWCFAGDITLGIVDKDYSFDKQ